MVGTRVSLNRHIAHASQRTKAAAEEAFLQADPKSTIIRPSIIFGPGDSFFTVSLKKSPMSCDAAIPVQVTKLIRSALQLLPNTCPSCLSLVEELSASSETIWHSVIKFGAHSRPVYAGDVARAIEICCRDDPKIVELVGGKIIEAGGPEGEYRVQHHLRAACSR